MFHVALATDVLEAVDRLFRADAQIDTLAKAAAASDLQRVNAVAARDAEADDDAPIVQIANRVIAQGMRDRASDVHIEPLEDSIRVRYRIDGTLVDVFNLPLGILPALVSRFKIMAGMNIVERRRPQDGQFSTSVDGRDLDVRVSTVATVMGEKIVARLLDKSRSALALSRPRDAARHQCGLGEARPRAVRHGRLRRPDRRRQDHDALRHAARDQLQRQERDDDRRPGRVRVPRHQPDPDERRRRRVASPRA